VERRIIHLQTIGNKLQQLGKEDIHNKVVDLLSELRVIAGAMLVSDEKERTAQIEIIKRFLISSFPFLSKEEILNAFYMNAAGQLDNVYRVYGKPLDCEFLGDVLRAYQKEKSIVWQTWGKDLRTIFIEEQTKALPVSKYVDWSFWETQIQSEYNYHRGLNPVPLHMWHKRKYQALRRKGFIRFDSVEHWVKFIKNEAEKHPSLMVYKTPVNLKSCTIPRSKLPTIFLDERAFNYVITEAQKTAYKYILRCLYTCGINNIFEEVKN
jgi:hypothetical protein